MSKVLDLTNGELLSLAEGLRRIGGEKLPFKVGYAISRTKDALIKRLDAIEQDRVKIVREYAGDTDSVLDENQEAFAEAWKEYLGKVGKVSVFQFPLEWLDNSDTKLASDTIYLIDPLFLKGE